MNDVVIETQEQCAYYAALAGLMTLLEAQRVQPVELIVESSR